MTVVAVVIRYDITGVQNSRAEKYKLKWKPDASGLQFEVLI